MRRLEGSFPWLMALLMAVAAACGTRKGGTPVTPEGQRLAMATAKYDDADGIRHEVAGSKGRVVLMVFWTAHCRSCVRALSEVAQLQGSATAEAVVLAVSVDARGWTEIRPFLNANPGLGLRAVVLVPGTLPDPFGVVTEVPTTVVLDRQGCVRERWTGHEPGRIRHALQRALDEPRRDSR